MKSALKNVHYFNIQTLTDVANATSTSKGFARKLGFNLIHQTMIATSISELGSNIIKYANEGYITLAAISEAKKVGVEIIAEDHGPGIKFLDKAMTDNLSTGNTLGLGLPGVKRLMDEFLIESSLGNGTKIVARKWIINKC